MINPTAPSPFFSSAKNCRSDPRLRNRSPNIVVAGRVQTDLSDYWSQAEIEGRNYSLKRFVNVHSIQRDMAYPYCGVA